MSEWREEDWDDLKKKALIGVAFAGATLVWMVFARPGEEAPSSRGFNMGAESGQTSGSTGRPFAPRAPKTGLDMVSSAIGDGPAGVTPNILPGSSDAGSSAPAASAPPPSSPAPAAAAAPPAPESAADEAKNLAAAGIPTDAKGLGNLGAQPGLLSALAAKLLDHPNILKAVFNNKTVVDAFMNRKLVKQNCESAGALKSYLSDSNSTGMQKVFPVIQQALSSPGTASGLVSALADTQMVKRMAECPSAQAMSGDSTAVVSIAMSNPKALGLLMDPRTAAALAANPKAAGLLSGLQTKVGGAN